MTEYVVKSRDHRWVDLDDYPGPMSTGYPYLTDNVWRARRHTDLGKAFKFRDMAKGVIGGDLAVVEVELVEVRVLDELNTKTAYEWLAHYGLYILDPDGWRHKDGVTMETPITLPDFRDRFLECTVSIPDKDALERMHQEADEEEGRL